MITLYGDRNSPMVRAVILFLKANNVEFTEVTVSLMKGEHKTNANMPSKTVPTLSVTGPDGDPFTLCQSTTILRYLGANHAVDGSWYADQKHRFMIDEFFDLFQAKIFPAMAQCIRNKILYKAFFQKSEPDMTKVSEGLEEFKSVMGFIKSHYLKDKTFMSSNDNLCVGDLLAVCCLEQMKLVDQDLIDEQYGKYFKDVTEKLDGYDDLCKEVRMLPQMLKRAGMM